VKIIIGICHPKDVHLWKYTIKNLMDDGNEVKILAWDKDIDLYLLNIYNFKYEIVGKSHKSLIKKTYDMLKSDIKVLKIAKKFKPDILVHGSPYLAHVSKAIGKPHIEFNDTEISTIAQLVTNPFSDVICTPSSFMKRFDPKKHITFDGYTELAYLHPRYFKPDPSVLDTLGLHKGERFIVMRFVGLEATHDIGHKGLTNREQFVERLEKYGRIFITSEKKLNKTFEKYRIWVPPEKMHDLLSYATLFIGEGATMPTESAILGTPALFINTARLGYTNEIEKKYDLLYSFSDPTMRQEHAFQKAIELLEDINLKNKWQKKREKLLNEKIDVTAFLTELIRNYPESVDKLRDKTSVGT
jgi:predicted glycosyltransferase